MIANRLLLVNNKLLSISKSFYRQLLFDIKLNTRNNYSVISTLSIKSQLKQQNLLLNHVCLKQQQFQLIHLNSINYKKSVKVN